jgi:hypothetical protein
MLLMMQTRGKTNDGFVLQTHEDKAYKTDIANLTDFINAQICKKPYQEQGVYENIFCK